MKYPTIFFFFGVSFSSLVGSCYLVLQEYSNYRENFDILSIRLEKQATQVNKILENISVVESLLLKNNNDNFWVIDFLGTFGKNLVTPEVLPTVIRSCFLLIVFFIAKRELISLCSFSSDLTWFKGLPFVKYFFTSPTKDSAPSEIADLLQNQKELASSLGKVITKMSENQNKQFDGIMEAFSVKSDFDNALLHSVLLDFSNKILLEIRKSSSETECHVLLELENLKASLTKISVVNDDLLSLTVSNRALSLPSITPQENLHEDFAALVTSLPEDQFST